MFFKSKHKQIHMVSPQNGEAIPMDQVPDAVFAEKILGDGVAIKPTDKDVFSPCDGTIAQIAHTFHALGIESDDGLAVLVHLGINTVELQGEGFQCLVEVGQKVKAGDKMMEMDIDLIEAKGLSTISPCLITNLDDLKTYEFQTGPVVGGETTVIKYTTK